MQINCPCCGNACEIESEPIVGQHLVCPFCSGRFSYADDGKQNEDRHRGDVLEYLHKKIVIRCPECGTEYEIDNDAIGSKCQCGICNRDFIARDDSSAEIGEAQEKESIAGAEKPSAEDENSSSEQTIKALSAKKRRVVFSMIISLAVEAKNRIVGLLKLGIGYVSTILTKERINEGCLKARATSTMMMNQTVRLWKGGVKGRIALCAIPLLVLCMILVSRSKVAESQIAHDAKCRHVTDNEADTRNDIKFHSNCNAERRELSHRSKDEPSGENMEIDLGGRKYQQYIQVMKLAKGAADEGDTINFYGFFPGMSRHDAQLLATLYELDGNDCNIHTEGEKCVYSITLSMKAVMRILKIAGIKCQTYEEIGQAVANAVGDMQVTTKTDFLGYKHKWADRTLMNGTCLRLAQNGMAINGGEDKRTSKPVETDEAKEQRLKVTDEVIMDIIKNMVKIPVKSGDLKPFQIGRYEVTQLQWGCIMGKNPSEHMSAQIGNRNSGDRPVDNVSWEDCQEFLKEFNSLLEVKKTGLVFRLPTQEEWEYACRAESTEGISRFSDGTELNKRNVGDAGWIEVSGDCKTKPVGLKKPNAFGLYDMIGNVSEWTHSFDDDQTDNYVYLGGDGSSKWDEKSRANFWHECARPTYKSCTRGFRLCASKFKFEEKKKKPRKFSATYTIDDCAFACDVCDCNVTITGVSSKTGTVNIPSTIGEENYPVKSIGERAFSRGKRSDCSDLTSVVIPNSVTNIDTYAFRNCARLESVTIGDSVMNIGWGTFEELNNLMNVTMGGSVTNIGSKAFSGCRKLLRLKMGDSIRSIGEDAFDRCESLAEVKFPDSLEIIGDRAFQYCEQLKNLIIPNSVISIGNNAFGGCEGLISVKPAQSFGYSLKIIGEGAFSNCNNLMSVTIPDSVVRIGDRAFHCCGSLNNLKIGDSVTSIGFQAFFGCSALKSVVLPSSVRSVGDMAFWSCHGLKNVTMSEGLESIGKSAFMGCNEIKSVTIPSSVINIGEAAFEGLRGLTNVKIGNGVTSIEAYTFKYCNALSDLTIGNSVVSIGARSFYGCVKLKTLKIPKSVKSIGVEAFYDCRELTSVVIPDSVEDIASDAFSGCDNLKNAEAPKRFLPLNAK